MCSAWRGTVVCWARFAGSCSKRARPARGPARRRGVSGTSATARCRAWGRQRRVVGKAEWLPGQRGANPRFVVTSLSREAVAGRQLYEELYCARGEMENRIKEQQLDLFADRTSTATMRANQLRMYFSVFAGTLLLIMRRYGLAAVCWRGPKAARSGAGS